MGVKMEKVKQKRRKKYTLNRVIAAMKDTGGIRTEICLRMKCAKKTLDDYIRNDPEIAEAYEEECCKVSDMARGKLFEAIETGQSWAIMFYLERKDPEYARKKSDVSIDSGSSPIEVVFRKAG
jgi:acyl CoA:acetate/3-ketoacid CoA transferase alpha subunit